MHETFIVGSNYLYDKGDQYKNTVSALSAII